MGKIQGRQNEKTIVNNIRIKVGEIKLQTECTEADKRKCVENLVTMVEKFES